MQTFRERKKTPTQQILFFEMAPEDGFCALEKLEKTGNFSPQNSQKPSLCVTST